MIGTVALVIFITVWGFLTLNPKTHPPTDDKDKPSTSQKD